jgi:predicted transcriptional regulator
MKCEKFVREYLPSVRAALSKELTSKGITQQQAAERLYLTQPAIAFYKRQSRGKKIADIAGNREAKEKISVLAARLFAKPIEREVLEREYCEFCRILIQ